ncbi:MAG: hypothetical protein U0893_07095 [Chloroflexota bacterium]
MAHLRAIRARVAAALETAVLLYLDEVTYYRQPSLASGYARPARPTRAPSAPPE